MKRTLEIVAFLLLFIIILAFNIGCAAGGADISLEGLNLGTVTMGEKPIAGLPSEKINLLLEVSARRLTVKYGADGTILILSPSGAKVEITASGISIEGVKPEQVKLEWAAQEPE